MKTFTMSETAALEIRIALLHRAAKISRNLKDTDPAHYRPETAASCDAMVSTIHAMTAMCMRSEKFHDAYHLSLAYLDKHCPDWRK